MTTPGTKDIVTNGRLTKNSVRCLRCGVTIESKHRHDFQSCACGDVFVDGGTDYQRVGWDSGAMFEDLSEWA